MNTLWPGLLGIFVAMAVAAFLLYYVPPLFMLLFYGVGWQ